ncbi:MAG: RNA polymerase sigma factor [Clostridia bacterium]|nr:RNA polymerase sigma factor [Clostridia bacterium]
MFDAEALLAGDEAALADAIDELSPELYRYAAGILLSTADAADAVQTAFVRLWMKRKSVRDPSAVRAWLYRSTYSACIDILRRNKLFVPSPRPETEKPMSDELAAVTSTNKVSVVMGGKHDFTGSDGTTRNMNMYHIDVVSDEGTENPDETEKSAPTITYSEKALANLQPYIIYPDRVNEDNIMEKMRYTVSTVEEMEEFLDLSFYLPTKLRENCKEIFMNVQDTGEDPLAILVVLIDNTGSYHHISIPARSTVVGTEAEIDQTTLEVVLPDGTSATAVMTANSVGRYHADIYYTHDNMLYTIRTYDRKTVITPAGETPEYDPPEVSRERVINDINDILAACE